jgi:hypothetical protein
MLADPAGAEAMGQRARAALVDNDISAKAMARQIEELVA